jgi:rhamnosyltransferase subunit B
MKSAASRRIVITTFGSYGDIHPYIPLALELQARGHSPVIATLPYYREKIEALGLEFHSVRPNLAPPEENIEMLEKAMDAKKGTEYIFKELLMPFLRQSYDDLTEITRGSDLLVTHPITLAGPIVADRLKVPWVSTVLAPVSFFSIYDPPETPAGDLFNKIIKLHPAVARFFFALVKLRLSSWISPVARLRAELELPAGAHAIFEGQHSPTLVLALFSKVFAQPQRDWPPNAFVTGFPFYDRRDGEAMSSDLCRFLDAGPPPIVFTLGSSAVWTAGDFYKQSIEAVEILGERAVLLHGHAQNLPLDKLPDGVAAFEYAPHSEVLPRARAVVHQGGIGTTAQSLRAGIPMLVVPFSHDQPDNAARVRCLGVARTLARKHYTATRVVEELKPLLTESRYTERANEVGHIVRAEDAARSFGDLIESRIFNS